MLVFFFSPAKKVQFVAFGPQLRATKLRITRKLLRLARPDPCIIALKNVNTYEKKIGVDSLTPKTENARECRAFSLTHFADGRKT